MGSFSFKKTDDIIFEINGEKFKVPYTQELLLKIEMLRKKAGKCVRKVEKTSNEQELLEVVRGFYQGSIDDILGKGAFDKIFEDRMVNLVDLQDIIFYLAYETEAYNNRRYADARYMPQKSRNKKNKKKRK
ncbi:hypothetical protein [Eubacterium limosum]|uniref:hypothetical protein n=1 Tax=Eubacterium limosum TaxID=1736 RepID=UPI001063DE54|nr:hypothetical protein [Eubacterium limosum]